MSLTTNRIFRFINWLFVILLVFLGIVLTVTISNTAIVIAIAGILISPYISDLVKKLLRITPSSQAKMIIVLLSLVITVVSIQEQVGLKIAGVFLKSGTDAQLEAFLKNQKERNLSIARKNAFLVNRNKQFFQLQTLYNSGDYEEVITQGTPYVEFDSTVKELVDEAQQKLDDQQKEKARAEAPQLLADGKFYEAYQLANKFADDPQLKNTATVAKQKDDEEVAKLKQLYEKGKYDNVIAQGTLASDFDCRVKELVKAAEEAKIKKDDRERADKAFKSAYRLLKDHHFEKAYEIAKDFKTDADLQEIARQAKEGIDSIKEKKILAKLKWTSSSNTQQFIEEYKKLVELFPDNEEYRSKLKFYREKLANSKKSSPNLVTRKEYGDKWPFTVAYGELSCSPPGIVTLWANEKTYALNELAMSRGEYRKIDEILKNPQVDTIPIISKGLALCQ